VKPIRDEYARHGMTAWFLNTYLSYAVWSTKPVKKLEDFKGLRLKVSGGDMGKMLKATGALATFMPQPEVYQAIERGTLHGCMLSQGSAVKHGIPEVVGYGTELSVFLMPCWLHVSFAALEKMSEKDREIFMEVGRRVSLEFGDAINQENERLTEVVKQKGVKKFIFPKEEREKWANLPKVKNILKEWLDEQNAAGRPGKEVLRTTLEIFEVPELMPQGY
jgi:TRAP-type C4-dicarboxylate transport system substrate-binding protein